MKYALSLVLAIATASISSADWPQFHGPRRDNRSSETGGRKRWPEGGPELLWRADGLGHGFTCATNRGAGSRWSIKTFPSYAPSGGLDKIFLRGGIQPVRVYRSRLNIAKVASDHLPVIADFEI